MTEWDDAWSQLADELREGLAEFDEAVPELVAAGQAEAGIRALTISRDAALALAQSPEWRALVRGIFDSRIDALRGQTGGQ